MSNVITLYVTPATRSALRVLCERSGSSASGVVRDLVLREFGADVGATRASSLDSPAPAERVVAEPGTPAPKSSSPGTTAPKRARAKSSVAETARVVGASSAWRAESTLFGRTLVQRARALAFRLADTSRSARQRVRTQEALDGIIPKLNEEDVEDVEGMLRDLGLLGG